ncbi:hypothetical protein CC78DRAFT_548056 [Lojkania enalia]|uniref:Zn(2)-C6 fungal-type domain-containing protein n=1 Tax=Lojkania enalia TaxID=147567 RepID=A0A9P4JZC3_9PLEO|nr:hypothetical protein CC78DRAFT_548056 [Didymosphaeria enalia]
MACALKPVAVTDERMERLPPGVTAPYGHACANCARAKCKCITREQGNCERCHRLGKECTPSAGIRKCGVRKPSIANRRSRLEDKLDDLVSLLRKEHTAKPQSTNISMPEQFNTANSQTNAAGCWINTPVSTGTKSTTTPQASPASNGNEHLDDGETLFQAEDMFSNFRTCHLGSFPFVRLPISVTKLKSEKPFLWSSIRAVCTRNPTRQLNLGLQFKEVVGKEIVDGQRSVDLLLALMVYSILLLSYEVSRGYYFARGRPYLGLLCNLIKTLISDLRIDKPIEDKPSLLLLCPKPFVFYEPPKSSEPLNNEGRRALLGSFVLISLTGPLMALRIEPMRWVPQMDDSLEKLSMEEEYPEDKIIVAITRIARVTSEALQLTKRALEEPDCAESLLLHIKCLQTSIEKEKSIMPIEMLQNKIVSSFIYNAEAVIYSAALPHTIPLKPNHPYEFRRIQYLHSCLQAVKSCLENFLSISQSQHIGISMIVWTQFSHSLQTLYYLCMLDYPGWDREAARATADPVLCMERAIVIFEQMHADMGIEDDSVLTRGIQAMKMTVPVWRAAVDKSTSGSTAPVGGNMAMMDPTLMEMPDDVFADIFGPWS